MNVIVNHDHFLIDRYLHPFFLLLSFNAFIFSTHAGLDPHQPKRIYTWKIQNNTISY